MERFESSKLLAMKRGIAVGPYHVLSVIFSRDENTKVGMAAPESLDG